MNNEKQARWISHEEDDLKISDYRCSNCGKWSDEETEYCPCCNSKMTINRR